MKVKGFAPTMRVTAQHVDQAVAKQRLYDATVAELVRANEDSEKLTYSAKSEVKLLAKRRLQERVKTQSELNYDAEKEKEKADTLENMRRQEQNFRLADTLEKKIKAEEFTEREIQRICANSEELKDLEKKLKIAYVNKERAAQHQEQILLKNMERERDLAIEDYMEQERQRALQKEVEKSKNKGTAAKALREDILSQLAERQVHLQEAEDEAKRDKERIDAIVSNIAAQDRAEREALKKHKEDTREMLINYARQHEREVAERKRKEQEEMDKIRAYQEAMANRDNEVAAKKAEKQGAADAAYAKIVEEVRRKRAEEEEMIMLQEVLMEEEAEAARIQAEKNKKEKEARDRAEMARHNEEMIRRKAEARAAELAEEKRLIDAMKRKFAEDEKREKEEALARLHANQEYQRQVRIQQQATRAMFEEEKNEEIEKMKQTEEYEAYKAKVVAEARRRLLEEHAAKLNGYLPKGVIKSKEDQLIIKGSSH